MAEITEQFNIQSAIRNGMIGIPVVLLSILAMLVVPMPPIMLDLFFSFNIALAMVVILSSIYTKRPLDFAVFPTVLLLTTLLRLALNIASTRIVLLDGHQGAFLPHADHQDRWAVAAHDLLRPFLGRGG